MHDRDMEEAMKEAEKLFDHISKFSDKLRAEIIKTLQNPSIPDKHKVLIYSFIDSLALCIADVLVLGNYPEDAYKEFIDVQKSSLDLRIESHISTMKDIKNGK